MKVKTHHIVTILIGTATVVGIAVGIMSLNPGTLRAPESSSINSTNQPSLSKLVDFSTINQEFGFLAEIPNSFEIEYLPNVRAINVYDPSASGETLLEKSQLYISYFKADTFLTLKTVNITRKDPITIENRQAVLYEITKKDSVPAFAGQPSWRNNTHLALDIRASSKNPSYFYSFAYNPQFGQNAFNQIIDSLIFKN